MCFIFYYLQDTKSTYTNSNVANINRKGIVVTHLGRTKFAQPTARVNCHPRCGLAHFTPVVRILFFVILWPKIPHSHFEPGTKVVLSARVWQNSYFRYKCEKVVLFSWRRLRPSEARVKRPHEYKITFLLMYRTQFCYTTCTKLDLAHAFLFERS